MAMTEVHRRILEKSAPNLLNDLDVDDVVPNLLADQALTRDDVDKISTKQTRREKVSQLLDIIPRRGDGAYVSLLNSLLQTEGSEHLYHMVKSFEEELQLQQEDNDPHSGIQESATDSINADIKMEDGGVLEGNNLVGLLPSSDTAGRRQPLHPNKVLKDENLLELAKELGEHWEMLGQILGLKRAVIYQCKENNRYNTQSQIFDMLYKWKCKKGKAATVSALLDACRQIDTLDEEDYAFLYSL